jgi:hypothetical protein
MTAQRKQGQIAVTAQYKHASVTQAEQSSDEPLMVQTFESEPALVSITLGRTINLGDYNSVTYKVGVTLPCYPEETVEALDAAQKLAGNKLLTLINRMMKKQKQG